MCGDHRYYILCEDCEEGSPPHVRGPLFYFRLLSRYSGITPACAGTTLAKGRLTAVSGDHPRMCGDH